MQDATVLGHFNPTKEGDTFVGLNGSIKGSVGDTIEQNLHKFLQRAGRDYEVRLVPAYVMVNGTAEQVPERWWVQRTNDNRVISPKTVTRSYATQSLMGIADEVQQFCDQGWATPDGVYSGKNESLEVLSLRLDAGGADLDPLPRGERFMHYIVIQNPHGQGGKIGGKIIDFRIVCGNTFAMAVSAGCDFTIPHRIARDADAAEVMKERTSLAVQQWQNVQDHIRKLSDRINVFSGVKLAEADALNLTDRLLGIADKSEDQISTQAENKRDAIMGGFKSQEAGTKGETAWDWLNGVTWYTSSPKAKHNAKSKVGAVDRMIRNIDGDGTGATMEVQARKLVEALV